MKPTGGTVDKWQQYTMRANTEYSLEFFGNSILLHNQALDYARLNYAVTSRRSADLAISRVVISHFNLADCYIALADIDRASECYLAAQSFLLDIGTMAHNPAVLDAINHALGHVNYMWLDFMKKHREQLAYSRMLQYHETSRVISRLEADHAVCH